MNTKSGIISAGLSAISIFGVYQIYKFFSKKEKEYSTLSNEKKEVKPLDIKSFKHVLNEIMENVVLKLIVGNEILREQEEILKKAGENLNQNNLNDKVSCKIFAKISNS
jgi:hypothetical protein